ncbi:hypothetical protein PLESTM_000565100 [Pleodorina starrii]|nr:hypothetical protein PLESTM_000565100 [Pleodorina starrii]
MLHAWVEARQNLKKVVVGDTVLLGSLKNLGVLSPKASVVKLASCTAVHAALRGHRSLAPVAEVVRQLGLQRPSLSAVNPAVTPVLLAHGEAFEARLPPGARRGGRGIGGPPTRAADAANQAATATTPASAPSPPPPAPASTPAAAAAARPFTPAAADANTDATVAPATSTPTTTATTAPTAPASVPTVATTPADAAAADAGPSNASPSPAAAARRPAAATQSRAAGSGAGTAATPRHPYYYPVNLPFTSTLPNIAWAEAPGRIGLLAMLKSSNRGMPAAMPLMEELDDFEAWCTAHFNFLEGGKGGVSTATYRGINNTVSKVLGFTFSCLAIPMAYISLRVFSNQDILVKFIDFVVKRWGCNHALVEITRLVKVVAYLKHKDAGGQPPSPDSAAKVGHCGRLVGWLHNIQRQLRRDYPTAPPQAPQPAAGEGGGGGGGGAGEDEGDADDNGLPSMSEVLSFVMTLRRRADRVLARDLGALGSGPVSYEAAVLQMHALLTEFLSGAGLRPARLPGQQPEYLMDAREPSLADRPPPSGPASSSKWPQPSLPDPASISSSSGRRLVVEITHHKTERFSRNQPPLRLVLPAELSSSVRQYVQYARPVLMHRAARPLTLTLVRNLTERDARNYLVINQVATKLQEEGAAVSQRMLHAWVEARQNLKKVVVGDTVLLGSLKNLGVLSPKASVVKLASCTAVHAALRGHRSLAPVAEVVRQLGLQRPSLSAVNPAVTPVLLAHGEAFEARLPPAAAARPFTPAAADANTDATVAPATSTPTTTATTAPTAPASVPTVATTPADAAAADAGPSNASPSPAAAARRPAAATQSRAAGSGAGTAATPRHPYYYPVNLPFTSTLPNIAWAEAPGRIGLLAMLKSSNRGMPAAMPLMEELDDFEAWCTAHFNFLEGGKGGVSTATYRGINNTVSKVLGFTFSCLAIPMAYISLRVFSNQDILVKFIDFVVKRWGCNHALVEITRLVKVVAYLKHKDAGGQPPSPDSAAKVGHCGRLVGWLHNIQRQLRRDYPTAPPQAPQPAAGEGGGGGGGGAGEDEGDADDNGLPSMSEVLSFVMTLRRRADRVLARDLGALGSGPVSYEAAVLQMHALLTEFLSGVYMPPMRMSSLCTLMVPGQDTCQEQDCGRQGCRGNNLNT